MTDPNVLLVVMDSVRAENTTLHGHRYDTTPFLTTFAETTATVHTQARAPSQWSLPSHATLFTGAHVPEHGVTSDGDSLQSGETLFDDLRSRGYRTGVFSSNPYLTSLDTGLASGFDTVEGAVQEPLFEGVDPDEYKGRVLDFLRDAIASGRPIRSLANGVISKVAWDYPELVPATLTRKLSSGNVHGTTYTNLFCEWVEEDAGPWAACINYMDAHHPYTPKESTWDGETLAAIQSNIDSMPLGFYSGADPWWKCEVLEHLYDGTIRQVDQEISRLVGFLKETDQFDETLIVVTSDHGEGFGEYSESRDIRLAGHNVGESEVNLHVPLVVKRPEQATGKTNEQLTSLAAVPGIIKAATTGDVGEYHTLDTPVVARTQGLREIQIERLREKGVDVSPFEDSADTLYEAVDGSVRKTTRWGNRITCERYAGREESEDSRADAIGRLEETFTAFDDVGIRSSDEREDVDRETAERLEHLGYK